VVTVKVNVPAGSPVTILVVPVPASDTLSGRLIRVHVPSAGSPFSTTLPKSPEQVRLVTVPINGAEGTALTVRV
jgi:hypothetical protein